MHSVGRSQRGIDKRVSRVPAFSGRRDLGEDPGFESFFAPRWRHEFGVQFFHSRASIDKTRVGSIEANIGDLRILKEFGEPGRGLQV